MLAFVRDVPTVFGMGRPHALWGSQQNVCEEHGREQMAGGGRGTCQHAVESPLFEAEVVMVCCGL